MDDQARRHHEDRRRRMADYARRCGADTADKVRLLLRDDMHSDVTDPFATGGTNAAEIELVIELLGLND